MQVKTARKTSLSDPVYECLKNMILRLELKEGDKIPEARISEKLGVSRTPIREALRRLSNEGIVNIYPNRFAEVVTFDEEAIKNMGVARLTLDISAVKLAIYYGSNADFERMRDIANACFEASERNDVFQQNRYDIDFHREISRISGNPYIQKYQSQVFLQLEVLLNRRYSATEPAFVKAHDTHFKMVEAFMARDQRRAVDLIVEHIREFYRLDKALSFLL